MIYQPKKVFSPCKKPPFFSLRLLQNWSLTQVNSQFISFASLKNEAFFFRNRVFWQSLFKKKDLSCLWTGKNIMLVHKGCALQNIKSTFRESGAIFTEFLNSDIANDYLKKYPHEIDLLLIEVSLLNIGHSFILQTLKTLPGKILVFGLYNGFSDTKFGELRANGVSEFFNLPVNTHVLAEVIDYYFNGEFNVVQF